MDINEIHIAIIPDLKSSELTLGPTFSTLLKSNELPIFFSSLDLISEIKFLLFISVD